MFVVLLALLFLMLNPAAAFSIFLVGFLVIVLAFAFSLVGLPAELCFVLAVLVVFIGGPIYLIKHSGRK